MWSGALTDTEKPTLYSLLQLGSITVRWKGDSLSSGLACVPARAPQPGFGQHVHVVHRGTLRGPRGARQASAAGGDSAACGGDSSMRPAATSDT